MEKKVLKRTVGEICATCPNKGTANCNKDQQKPSTDGRIFLSMCMLERMGDVHIGQKNIFEYYPPTNSTPNPKQPVSEQKELFEPSQQTITDEKTITGQTRIDKVQYTDAPFKNWDDTYTRIIHCIKNKYTIAAIAKVLSLPRSTIRDRLTKLEKKGIISQIDTKSSLGCNQATFIITSKWAMKLVNDGQTRVVVSKPFKPEPVKFARHGVSLQAEILEGTIPKGDRSYHPKGWTGEIFDGNGTYGIRVIPNKKGIGRAVIDIYLSVGATSSADLTMKYHGIAERYLGAWGEKHNIKLGQITEYRKPHTTIEGSRRLAQTILSSVGGESKFVDLGVQVDESDKEHNGEVEFHEETGEESLRNFEFALNQSPQKMEKLESKFDALRDSMHQEVKNVENGISGIQGWLILQRENDLLREQNQLLREQMNELTKQVNEMKSMLGLTPAPQPAKPGKYDDVGIYG